MFEWSFYELGETWDCFYWINSQVLIQNVTILAPPDSPHTDGIDPGNDKDLQLQTVVILFSIK